MTSGLLWYLNRGTGVVLLVLLSLTVVLGVLATGRGESPLWPRFVTQGLHRTLAALTVLLLSAHAVTAVVDEYVDIRWWHAVVPFGATYEPLWSGLGTLGLDLVLVVVATSLARGRLPHRAWFLVHLTTYAAWAAGVVHGIGIGTDSARPWMAATTAGCVAGVVLAAVARGVAVLRGRRSRRRRGGRDRGPGGRGGPRGWSGQGRRGDRAGEVRLADLEDLFSGSPGGTR